MKKSERCANIDRLIYKLMEEIRLLEEVDEVSELTKISYRMVIENLEKMRVFTSSRQFYVEK